MESHRDEHPSPAPGRRDESANVPIGYVQALFSGLLGLLVLIGLMYVGLATRKIFHTSAPGPVIGLVMLALVFLLFERYHERSHQTLLRHVAPVGRLLVSHLGLLFVPAGVGIIAEGETLRRDWLPLVVALLVSTICGLIATAWCMQRWSPKTREDLSCG